jgi:hypothetical protein
MVRRSVALHSRSAPSAGSSRITRHRGGAMGLQGGLAALLAGC